jgi:hypothetical protein
MKFSKLIFSVHSLFSLVVYTGAQLETSGAEGPQERDLALLEDEVDRDLGRRKKKSSAGSDENAFARSYTVISKPRDIVYISPSMGELRGDTFLWFGGMYRSSSVKLVPKDFGKRMGLDGSSEIALQPDTVPTIDPDFTFAARCTITSAKGQDLRGTGHSCFFDLCLGSPVDCVNVYAGGRFTFGFGFVGTSRRLTSLANKPNVNSQNKGTLEALNNDSPVRGALPPSFPGFVFGGVNRYEGIKGTFEIVTVTQRRLTVSPATINTNGGGTDTPTEAPTLTEEPTSSGQGQGGRRNLEVGEQPDKERKLQRVGNDDPSDLNGFQSGVITQKVFLVTNQRLPLGPKAV